MRFVFSSIVVGLLLGQILQPSPVEPKVIRDSPESFVQLFFDSLKSREVLEKYLAAHATTDVPVEARMKNLGGLVERYPFKILKLVMPDQESVTVDAQDKSGVISAFTLGMSKDTPPKLTFVRLTQANGGGSGSGQQVRITGNLKEDLDFNLENALGNAFSGSILVTKAGETVYSRSFGKHDQDRTKAAGRDTIYSIGSVTKLFTAISILKLADEGKLSLSDKISKYIPAAATQYSNVTIDQLIAHTAGMSEYVDEESEQGDFTPMTKAELIRRATSAKPRFAPGAELGYSNTGYSLLSVIVEEITKRPFVDFVRDEVFKKLDLKRTGFYGDKLWPADQFAVGQSIHKGPSGNNPTNWFVSYVLVGGGGIVSTPDDLNTALINLEKGALLGPEMLKKLFEGVYQYPNSTAMESRGWMKIFSRRQTTVYSANGGNMYGFHCFMNYYRDEKITIVVCSNQSENGAAQRATPIIGQVLFSK